MRVLIAIYALLTLSLAFSGPTSSWGSHTFRGHLIWGHEVRSFKPCSMEVEYWIVDRTGGELWDVYRALTHEPYQPLYSELRGHLGPPPSTGFGADYEKQLTVLELRRAARETLGCKENLGGIEFRASGNEPFWNVKISKDEILFSRLGNPEIVFPYFPPNVSGKRCVYFSKARHPAPYGIEITIDEKRCIDTMSGDHFSFVATVRLNDQMFAGCAKEGWPTVSETDTAFLGTYMSQLPAADSPGRVITLSLRVGQTVEMTHDYLNKKAPIVQRGTWERHQDGTLTVRLSEQDGRPIRHNITFKLVGDRLQAIVYDHNLYGSEGLTLTRQAGYLSMERLRNIEYKSEFAKNGKAKLTDGVYRESLVSDSAAELVIMLSQEVAYGDLDGDGAEDAAGVLVTNSGGSGTFRHLAAVLNDNESARNVATLFLGDRVKVKSIAIKSGEIVVEMITHGPNDPLCCPTVDVTQKYALRESQLVDAAIEGLLNRQWVLKSLGTAGSEQPLLPETAIVLEFNADGRLHGSGGCNRYFAAYVTRPGDGLTIKNIGSTRMACPEAFMDQEMRYFEALQRVSAFKVEKDLLQLFYENSQRVLNFIPSLPR